MSLTNKEKARLYHSAVSQHDVDTIRSMVREDYIQHNPMVPTGREAFLALIPNLKSHNTQIENLRIFQDGDHVIMHHLWTNAIPFGGDKKVAFHIIRFDQDGLIAEHWSVMSDTISDHDTRGPKTVERIHETDVNKEKVIQNFRSFVQPENCYEKQHKVFGSGNFVLSISEGTSKKTPTAFYDLFRMEKGVVVDHWNIYQEIPKENLANNNTMFNF